MARGEESEYAALRQALSWDSRLGRLRHRGGEVFLDDARKFPAPHVEGRRDRVHVRLNMARQDDACHLAEIEAEILDLLAVRHRQVSGHAYQKLVQHQAPRPERHEIGQFQPGKIAQLVRLFEARKDIRRAKYRAILAQLLWHRRTNAGVPRPKWHRNSRAIRVHGRCPPHDATACHLEIRAPLPYSGYPWSLTKAVGAKRLHSY
ncbi:MAG TPA: hypothetical protein VK820_10640 [Steroidobacteraceae bacterium]|nr:hypothetical protein [Steroidobacteraceae bacterium]